MRATVEEMFEPVPNKKCGLYVMNEMRRRICRELYLHIHMSLGISRLLSCLTLVSCSAEHFISSTIIWIDVSINNILKKKKKK